MGLLDFTSKVVTSYKADVSDHLKGLQKLKGEERKRAEAEIENNKKIIDAQESQLKTLGKLALGIGAVYAAAKTAIESYKYALEESRLEIGAQGVSLEGLRKASAGLRSDTDLLRDAVKFKSAAFKLSQKDMEDVEGAMRSLTRQGKDASKINEAITQSLTKLSTEGLQELGINIQKAGLSMDDAADRGELFKRVMAALRAESLNVADAELTKQEQMAASGVAFENAVDSMKRALGDMVTALAPLVQKVAELVAMLPKIGRGLGSTGGALYKRWAQSMGLDVWHDDTDGSPDAFARMQAGMRRAARVRELFAKGDTIGAGLLGMGQAEQLDESQLMAAIAGGLQAGGWSPGGIGDPTGAGYKGKGERDKLSGQAAAEAKRRADELRKLSNEWAKSVTDNLVEQLEGEMPKVDEAFWTLGENAASMFEALGKKLNEGAEAMTRESRYGAYNSQRSQTLLEQMFGPIEQFNQYAAAFNLLSGAVTAAMDAWITGSESMGTAVKKAIGAGLKALAAELAMQALRHGAYALGSLAFGDFRGASLHGAAAGKFALGAAATAVLAREFGHGGTSYGTGSGGGGGAGAAAPRPTGNGGVYNPRGNETIHIIGDYFDPDTNPRKRMATIKRAVKRVKGGSHGGDF